MANNKVALKICKKYTYETVLNRLKEGFALLGGIENFIKPKQKVLIKPDIYCNTLPNRAKTTHHNMVSAVAELVAKLGAKCIIADSPLGDFNQLHLDRVYEKTRMLEASNNGYATLNINDKIDVITNQNGEFCRDINIMDVINDVDVIINLGKFRCEKNLGLIGCSQNLFGLVPGRLKSVVKSRCHTLTSYYNYIIDLNEALEDKVVLNILDGIVGCEANGDPRILNSIIMGQSQYAVDCVALQIINQNPQEYLLFNECERRGKFDFDCDITGDKISSVVCEDFKYSNFLENIKPGSNGKFKREYNSIQKRPIISAKQCKGCKVCSNNCPMQAINIQSNQLGETAVINRQKCVNCLKCVDNCPYKIIKVKTPCKHYHIERMIKKHSKTNNDIDE